MGCRGVGDSWSVLTLGTVVVRGGWMAWGGPMNVKVAVMRSCN